MTENELRETVAGIIDSWRGAAKGSPTHLEILDIYNSHKPLARGYTVKTTDAYCATTVSAAFIKAGIAPYTGTECSCTEFIKLAKTRGIWVEDDGYVPKIGDAVVYDWQDSGNGDNVGAPDHIGIVTASGSGMFTVTEGNMSGGRVGRRIMAVNGKYIRGYICPDYAAIAKIFTVEEDDEMTGEEIYDKLCEYLRTQKLPKWARKEFEEAIVAGITDGSDPMALIPRWQAAIMAKRAIKTK